MHHFNSSLSFEHDAGDVRDRTGSKGPKAEFARIGPYISNQLGNRRDRECGVYLKHFCRTSKPRDHRNVASRVDCIGRDGREKRVTVRGRVGDFLRRDVSGGTRPVFNDKWLPQSFGKPLADQPCENVGRTAGGKSNV